MLKFMGTILVVGCLCLVSLMITGCALQEIKESQGEKAIVNRVLRLDGDGDYVKLPAPSHWSGNTPFTVSFWMRYSPMPRRTWVMDIGTRSNAILRNVHWLIGPKGITQFGFWEDLRGPLAQNNFDISSYQGQWVFISTVYEPSFQSLKTYLNGILTSRDNIPYVPDLQPDGINIGYGSLPWGTESYFNGLVDELRIFSIARATEQIQSTMNTTLTGQEEGLVGYWNFDDGAATDLSSNGNNGVLYGDAQIVEMPFPDGLIDKRIATAEINTADGSDAIRAYMAKAQAVTDGLVGYWGFDNVAGRTVKDDIGDHDGTIVGAALSTVEGRVGKALEFDGNGYVDIGAEVTELGAADFTIAAWIKTSSKGVSILSKGNGSGGWDFHEKELYIADSASSQGPNDGTIEYVGSWCRWIRGSIRVDDGEWHHIAVTWDRNSTEGHVYVDGVEGTYEVSFGRPDVRDGGIDNAGDTVRIGFAESGGDKGTNFIGAMDDVRIYSRVLNGKEVRQIMKAYSAWGEINTEDGFNTIPVNQTGRFLLEMGVGEISDEAPLKEIHIALPDEFQSSGVHVSGDVQLDEQTIRAKSTQEGQILKIAVEEAITTPGEIIVEFEAIAGSAEASSVVFSVRLLTVEGTVLMDELYGGNVNNNPSDLNGFEGIAIISDAPVPAPTSVMAEPVTGENDVRITWKVGDERTRGYEIYADGVKIGEVTGKDATSYTHTNAEPGVTISYTVIGAATGTLKSESSEAVTVKVEQDITAPQSPSIQVKRINPDSVKLTWTATSKDIARYVVYRGTSETDLEQIVEVGPEKNEYVDETMDSYLYAINVQDDRGNMAAKPLTLFPFFTDVAVMAGVSDAGIGDGSGFGEAVFGDYDSDGDLDLYVGNITQQPHVLYQNNSDGTFTDVTSSTGVQIEGGVNDVGFLDYDNDGHLDLYVIYHPQSPGALYHNNGDGTFVDLIDKAGISAISDSHIALFADYDGDGYLDIYITRTKRNPNILYHNNGDGTFTDVTDTAGVGNAGDTWDGLFLDYDNDGDLDIYVMNHMNLPNALYRNNGDSTFTDVAMTAGLGKINHRHGCAFGDYNNDGYLDIYIAIYNGPNLFYRNNGDGTFTDVSATVGVDHPGSSGRAAFVDYDNDGYLDLYVVNDGTSANILYRNNGDSTFSDVTELGNVSNIGKGGGVVSADYDGDGDLDFYLTNRDAPSVLYRNNGNSNNWLHIKLVGTVGNQNGIGARVKVIAGALSQIRQVGGSAGRNGEAVLPIVFGLGNHTQADRIEIRWPSGVMQTLAHVPANQVLIVTEEMLEHDIMVRSITVDDMAEPMKPVTPQAQLRNVGSNDEMDVPVTCEIIVSGETVYSDTQTMEKIASLGLQDVSFAQWEAQGRGEYEVRVTVNLPGDENKGNDSSTVAVTPLLFSDVTAIAGLKLEADASITAFGDYNSDGYPDIYVTCDGPNILYRNNGDGTFTDATSQVGIEDSGKGIGPASGDYSDDSHLDLYFTNPEDPNVLYRSSGDGTILDTAAAAGVRGWGGKTAFGDYDNDGDLDIYVAKDGPNILYRNDGDSAFTDVTAEAGVIGGVRGSRYYYYTDDSGRRVYLYADCARGVSFGDYDNDGDLDLYVANAGANVLYCNNGNGTFRDVTSQAGVGNSGWAHGSAFGDYDNDGDLDIYVGNTLSASILYRNNGDGVFTDVSGEANMAIKGSDGISLADYNNDGYLDICISSKGLYYNNEDGTFTNVTDMAGVHKMVQGPGLISVDYDMDGDLDVGSWHALYRNDGDSKHWLHVNLVGTMSNRDGIGARVKVVCGTTTQIREVTATFSYKSYEGPPVEFGLGDYVKADRVEIRWPSGIVQTLVDVSADQLLTVTEEIPEHDVMVKAITAPGEVVEPMTPVTPQAQLRNMGASDEMSVMVTCEITAAGEMVYSDTQSIDGIASLKLHDVSFAQWTPQEGGRYEIKVTTELPADENKDNDVSTIEVATLLFANVTEAAGLVDEAGGECVVMGDYDGDGDVDLYTGHLYGNEGDGVFADVTDIAGLATIESIIDAAFGDIDGDGDLDILIIDGQDVAIYLNDGDGTFDEITPLTGVKREGGVRALCLADYDGDGHLDIYFARIGPNRLYHNNGDGTFADVTETTDVGDAGWSEAAIFGDCNGDSAPDIYVANWGAANVLYRNNGDGTFTDISDAAGIGHPGSAKDILFCDYDGDGDSDLFVANGGNQPDVLYRNNGDETFTDVTIAAGLGGQTWTEAAACGDYNGDGHPDLYLIVSSGANLLYRNNGDGTFSRTQQMSGGDAAVEATAAAFFDYDGDGDVDLFIANFGQPNALYRNTTRRSAENDEGR